jgi:hypothetical protein
LTPGRQRSNRALGFRALLRRSSQIAAYRRISGRISERTHLPAHYEIPASCYIRGARLLEIGVIAMQKVEGSNPFSRFVTKADLHQLVDRLPDRAVDGAAILLEEISDGRIDPEQAGFWTRDWAG